MARNLVHSIVGSCALYAPKKTERTLRTKKPKAHFYFPDIKYKVTIHNTHISVMVKFSVLRIKM